MNSLELSWLYIMTFCLLLILLEKLSMLLSDYYISLIGLFAIFLRQVNKTPEKYPFQAALASSKEAFTEVESILAKHKVTSKADALLTRLTGISAELVD